MTITYSASHTLARFHASNASVRGIMGPIGSGKSVGCCMEILARAHAQVPNRENIRKTRWAVIRNTYPELKSTTIQTWKDWVPEKICPIVYDTPIRAKMFRPLGDGTMIDMEVYFLAIDSPSDVKKLLSLELTGAFINEARELSKVIIDAALSRTGRYPSKADCPAGISWAGIIMDTNPPDDDHWWYRQAEDVKPRDWAFFRQPGALIAIKGPDGRPIRYEANPAAENVQHHQLGYQYWMRLVEGSDPEWVKVHCCGEYGTVFDGKPVYDGVYRDAFHVSNRSLGVFRGLPIQLGWDYGLTPACAIMQLAPNGQLRILREYVCERGGIKQFATDVVKPALTQLFDGIPVLSTGDPAGRQASQADELTCFEALSSIGIPTSPAPTNAFLSRRQAVIDRLVRTIDGQPALLIDPSCRMIRRGFRGGYKFKRVRVSGEDDRYHDVPDKNMYSHIHDALQYGVLGTDTVRITNAQAVPPPNIPTWGGFT